MRVFLWNARVRGHRLLQPLWPFFPAKIEPDLFIALGVRQ
jgi:hypothetical protein